MHADGARAARSEDTQAPRAERSALGPGQLMFRQCCLCNATASDMLQSSTCNAGCTALQVNGERAGWGGKGVQPGAVLRGSRGHTYTYWQAPACSAAHACLSMPLELGALRWVSAARRLECKQRHHSGAMSARWVTERVCEPPLRGGTRMSARCDQRCNSVHGGARAPCASTGLAQCIALTVGARLRAAAASASLSPYRRQPARVSQKHLSTETSACAIGSQRRARPFASLLMGLDACVRLAERRPLSTCSPEWQS